MFGVVKALVWLAGKLGVLQMMEGSILAKSWGSFRVPSSVARQGLGGPLSLVESRTSSM